MRFPQIGGYNMYKEPRRKCTKRGFQSMKGSVASYIEDKTVFSKNQIQLATKWNLGRQGGICHGIVAINCAQRQGMSRYRVMKCVGFLYNFQPH